MNWKGLAQYLIARGKEPSTWIGLGTVLAYSGHAISPDLGHYIEYAGVGLAGILGVVLKEGGSR